MHNRLVEFFPFISTMLRTSSHAWAFVADDSTVLFASPEFCRIFGEPLEVIEGQSIYDLLRFSSATRNDLKKSRSWNGEITLGENAFSVHLQRTAPMAQNESLAQSAVLPESSTALRNAASGIRRPGIFIELFPASAANDSSNTLQPHQRSRLESLGTLSGGIAHDLNNILAGILGHVSFLRLSLPMEGSDQESLETIELATKRAAQLTKQILEFARGDRCESQPTSLGSIVSDVVKLIQTSVPKGVRIETSGINQSLYVNGDEGQLSQLVLNLAVNARDAVGERGSIRIEVGSRQYVDAMSCADLGIKPGSYVVLSVRDTGPGIDESIRSKIFEPFFTTKKENGTGLGLSTVQAIVRGLQGLLVVDSALGQGTCFEIALPQAQASSVGADPGDSEKVAPKGSERVLIVDDEDSVRLIMEKSLEHLGYSVVSATNGRDALELFNQGRYSLVVLDMIMPGMAGDELFEHLQQIDPSVRVLIASGYASDGRIRKMLADGARGFIQKPFAIEELAEEVRRCLDTEGQLDTQAA
jgi:two-component system cell cycle sensor histidine kinase/response regulator CckA